MYRIYTVAVNSPTVFIGHDSRNALLAHAVAKLLESTLSANCRFSTADTLQSAAVPGEAWRDWIERTIKDTSVALFLLTPYSQHNQWVLYEAGMAAAFCPTGLIPVLAGLSTAALPRPMTDREAVAIHTAEGVRKLVDAVAGLSSCRPSMKRNIFQQEFLTRWVSHWFDQ